MELLKPDQLRDICNMLKEMANFHGGSNKNQRVYWNTNNPRFEVVDKKTAGVITITDHLGDRVTYNRVVYHCDPLTFQIRKAIEYYDTGLGAASRELEINPDN